MNILHVASFVGNIGDNANHSGMRQVLSKVIPGEHHFTELEIRKCYRIYTGDDRWHFDQEFSDSANLHDFVIVGGGNFFEPWITESSTGTTIDLPDAVLNSIKVPILFYGVGFDTYKPCSEPCLLRFKAFLDNLHRRENVIVTFRNDGSYKNLISVYGEEAQKFKVVPDGGFFFEPLQQINLPLEKDAVYWGVNVASDMKNVRFHSKDGWEQFLKKYAQFLSDHLKQMDNLQLILFPHIFSDLEAIAQLISFLDDRFCRSRIQVAPYVYGQEGADKVFGLYHRCSLVMGMRFHTNVCAIGMGLQTIGLSSSPKIFDLYAELGLEDRVVDVNQADFIGRLTKLVNQTGHVCDTALERRGSQRTLLFEKAAGCFEMLKQVLNRSAIK